MVRGREGVEQRSELHVKMQVQCDVGNCDSGGALCMKKSEPCLNDSTSSVTRVPGTMTAVTESCSF